MIAIATDARNAFWTSRRAHKGACLSGLVALGVLLGTPNITLAATSADNVRSSEKALYSAEQISASLAEPALPDPIATLLSGQHTNATQAEPRHRTEWDDNDAWITDIGTLLYRDDDQDGYFTGFSLDIDSDTRYSYTEVYAVIDIQGPSGAREFLHRTADFSLYSNSFSDEYRIDIELVQNFPAGEFDLFIELIDAHTSRSLDRVSAHDFYNLAALPLESEDFDQQAELHSSPTPLMQNDDVRVVEYAGSTGLFTMLSLASLLLMRRLKKSDESARPSTARRQV